MGHDSLRDLLAAIIRGILYMFSESWRLVTAPYLGFAQWWNSIPVWWHGDGWPWISAWVQSSGFAGFSAVMAATLAFAGVRHQARLNAWWQRFEWALNLYASSKSTQSERMTGLAAIGALQQSRLARKGEQDYVAEILDANTLDPLGDGVDEDDLERVDDDGAIGEYGSDA